MHIPSWHPGQLPLARAAPDADPPSTADRDPRGPAGRARPPVTRVFEGELVARPTVAGQLLDPTSRLPLTATATAPEPTDPTPPSAVSSQTLFYLLHSSDDRLGAGLLGRHLDLRV